MAGRASNHYKILFDISIFNILVVHWWFMEVCLTTGKGYKSFLCLFFSHFEQKVKLNHLLLLKVYIRTLSNMFYVK